MAQRRGFPQGRGSVRRKTDWGFGPSTSGIVLSLSAAGTAVSDGVTPGFGALTIVRTRGAYNIELNSSQGVAEGAQIALGLCKVTSEAFAVGATAIPDPVTDDDWDGWFWYQYVGFHRSAAATQIAIDNATFVYGVIDSKAMRRVDVSEVVCFVMGLEEEISSVTATLTMKSRLLIKSD